MAQIKDLTASGQSSAPAVALNRYPAIILAAGMSRRMGSIKALLPIAGQPMICGVIQTCLESECLSNVIVVTGHQSSVIQGALVGQPVSIVYNPTYESGEMLSSVKVGVCALPAGCAAFYLLPCDQPLLESSTFVALARVWVETASVVIPVYRGKRGHPVLISASLIPAILGLGSGDTLKTALVRYRDSSIEVEVDDVGVLFDVDTPEEYERTSRAER